MTKDTVLVIGSNATRMEVRGGTGPTGNYLNETVVPMMALIAAGYDVVLATPTEPSRMSMKPRTPRRISVATRPLMRVPRPSGQMTRQRIRSERWPP